VTDDSERLAALERRIARLEEALRARNSGEQRVAAERLLAGELTQPNTAERPTPHDVPPTPPRPMPKFVDSAIARAPKRDWEALIGRYGTLILATVTALAAVGTFIGWAIANGWLGPTQRIVLGLVTAAALAAWGMRLRQRERSFGASVIGIALAIVHVCAWGAGPSLHLVPTTVAFVLAAVASLALETFAHLEDDETLWSVGFFGAAIAPFVTSDGSGSMPLLAAYGVGVLVSGGYVLGNRAWSVANRLFVMSAALYTGALMLGWEKEGGPLLAMAFPMAVGYLGVLRWSVGWKRRLRLRGLGVLAAVASTRAAFSTGLPISHVTLSALIGAVGTAWLALVVMTHDAPAADDMPAASEVGNGDRLDAGWLALAFAVMAAVVPYLETSTPTPAGFAMAIAAAIVLATHTWYPANGLRDGAAFAVVAFTVAATALLAWGNMPVVYGAAAVVGAAAFAADLWKPSSWWTGSGAVAIAWAMAGALGLLGERQAYTYAPFLTSASAASAVVFGSAVAAWRLARERDRQSLAAGGAVVWGFVWVHQEIAFAFNTTASTLLRVSYYAATSVAAVAVGRARQRPILRHAGLGLAVIAAGTALVSASHLRAVGARIFADLVAAAFLLAIAFWYRKPGVAAPPATESSFQP